VVQKAPDESPTSAADIERPESRLGPEVVVQFEIEAPVETAVQDAAAGPLVICRIGGEQANGLEPIGWRRAITSGIERLPDAVRLALRRRQAWVRGKVIRNAQQSEECGRQGIGRPT